MKYCSILTGVVLPLFFGATMLQCAHDGNPTMLLDFNAQVYSVKTHGAFADLRILLDSTGTTSDSRDPGPNKFKVVFTQDVTASTFVASAVSLRGRNAAQTDITGTLPAVQSMSYDTATKTGTITFAANLPDQARYLLRISNIQSTAGQVITVERGFYTLAGDIDGNLILQGAGGDSTAYARYSAAPYLPFSATSSMEVVRSDVDLDAQVEQDDWDYSLFGDGTSVANIQAP